MSSLPLANNLIEIQRGMTTSSAAIFVPFTTQELFQAGNESLYYGLNALSNNLIMVDRKLLKNPNGLILGTPGSGKSFSVKREILDKAEIQAMPNRDLPVVVIDFGDKQFAVVGMNEFTDLVDFALEQIQLNEVLRDNIRNFGNMFAKE